ncbi:MAG: AAA family ATPase [Lentisphaerota bacterium]
MYKDYWHLKELPFENVPDPKFFYASRGHEEAVTRLLFAVETHKMIGMLTGDYGSGKTLVCQTLMSRMAANDYKIAFVRNPRLEAVDLTREIASQLGEAIPSSSKYDVLHVFESVLERHATAGRHCVAIIDESQLVMNPQVLEDLRLLLNFQTADQSGLTLIFSGQTEFNDLIKSIPQLRQRIGIKFHIPHLEPDEVRPYMAHRLEASGGRLTIFEDQAVEELARVSKGNPREINALADLCMLFGFMTGSPIVSSSLVGEAQKERA